MMEREYMSLQFPTSARLLWAGMACVNCHKAGHIPRAMQAGWNRARGYAEWNVHPRSSLGQTLSGLVALVVFASHAIGLLALCLLWRCLVWSKVWTHTGPPYLSL